MNTKKADGAERVIPATEFWTDYYECALDEDELLCSIEVDPLPDGFRTAYTRFTTRSKEDKPCVSISTAVLTEDDGKTAREVRIGLAGPRPCSGASRRRKRASGARNSARRTSTPYWRIRSMTSSL